MTSVASQQDVFKTYYELLQTIEEGLLYVEASFDDETKTEADRILSDVLAAFSQLTHTNEQLQKDFAENKTMMTTVDQYETVLRAVLRLEGHMNDYYMKQRILIGDILPTFEKWKTRMEQQLHPQFMH